MPLLIEMTLNGQCALVIGGSSGIGAAVARAMAEAGARGDQLLVRCLRLWGWPTLHIDGGMMLFPGFREGG